MEVSWNRIYVIMVQICNKGNKSKTYIASNGYAAESAQLLEFMHANAWIDFSNTEITSLLIGYSLKYMSRNLQLNDMLIGVFRDAH